MKDGIIIRRAKSSESQAIRKLEKRVWGEEVVNKYDIAMFVRYGYVFVAVRGADLIGAIVAFCTKADEVFVCDIVIDSRYRRRGLGEKLYRRLLKATAGRNIVTFVDPKLIASVALHKKISGKIIARVNDPYNLDDDSGRANDVRFLFSIKN